MLMVSLVSVSGCRRRWNTFHICCLIFRNVSFLFARLLWFNLLWFHPKHSYKTVVYFQTDIFHSLLTNPSLPLKPNADQESVNTFDIHSKLYRAHRSNYRLSWSLTWYIIKRATKRAESLLNHCCAKLQKF